MCAAISVLVQTIAQNVYDAADEGRANIIDISIKSGDSCVTFTDADDALLYAVDGICEGFRLLSDSYPERVNYTEEI